jgi:hypothetical protein
MRRARGEPWAAVGERWTINGDSWSNVREIAVRREIKWRYQQTVGTVRTEGRTAPLLTIAKRPWSQSPRTEWRQRIALPSIFDHLSLPLPLERSLGGISRLSGRKVSPFDRPFSLRYHGPMNKWSWKARMRRKMRERVGEVVRWWRFITSVSHHPKRWVGRGKGCWLTLTVLILYPLWTSFSTPDKNIKLERLQFFRQLFIKDGELMTLHKVLLNHRVLKDITNRIVYMKRIRMKRGALWKTKGKLVRQTCEHL